MRQMIVIVNFCYSLFLFCWDNDPAFSDIDGLAGPNFEPKQSEQNNFSFSYQRIISIK